MIGNGDKMKEKGQALVEFIFILPILLLVFMALIDIGTIFIEQYKLNDNVVVASELYQNDKQSELKAFTSKEQLVYEQSQDGELIKITLSKTLKINTPILSNILGKNYKISGSKSFYKSILETGDPSE